MRFVSELGQIRQQCRGALAKGTIKFIDVTSDYCIFRREDKETGEAVVIYLNKSHKAKTFMLHETLGEECRPYQVMRDHSRDSGKLHISPFDYEVVFIK